MVKFWACDHISFLHAMGIYLNEVIIYQHHHDVFMVRLKQLKVVWSVKMDANIDTMVPYMMTSAVPILLNFD